jgi:hypothetical protein
MELCALILTVIALGTDEERTDEPEYDDQLQDEHGPLVRQNIHLKQQPARQKRVS